MKKHNSGKINQKEIHNNSGEMSVNLWDFNKPRKQRLYEKERKGFEFESNNEEDENTSIESIPHSNIQINNQIQKLNNKNKTNKNSNNTSNKKLTSYKPQISLPNSNIKNKNVNNNNIKIKKTKSVERTNISNEKKIKKNSSLDKKSIKQNKHYNLSVDLTDYKNPDNVIKYIKNKCVEQNKLNKKEIKKKKTKDEVNEHLYNLYKRPIASNDYEKLKRLKKLNDDEKEKKELSECTFKPQLYSNKYNKKIDSNSNHENLYDKQNKWLNNKNEKLEKKYEKKVNKEMENCSFNPKINKMPDFNKKQIKSTNREMLEQEMYYSRIKNARRKSQEIEKKNDLIAKYDARKKREENIKFSVYNNNNNINYENKNNNKSKFSSAEKNKNKKKNIMNMFNAELNNNDDINNSNDSDNIENKNINSCDNLINGNNFTLTNQNFNNINNINNDNNHNNHNNSVDEEFQRQKEMLMNELHNWKNDENNSEDDDEFY